MKILARILPGILGLLFLAVGLVFMINPSGEAVLARLSLTPEGIVGLATIRSVIGGTFVTMGILLASAALKGHAKPVLIVGIFLTVALIGRIFGLVLDGSNIEVLRPVIIEIVLIAICAFSYVTLKKS